MILSGHILSSALQIFFWIRVFRIFFYQASSLGTVKNKSLLLILWGAHHRVLMWSFHQLFQLITAPESLCNVRGRVYCCFSRNGVHSIPDKKWNSGEKTECTELLIYSQTSSWPSLGNLRQLFGRKDSSHWDPQTQNPKPIRQILAIKKPNSVKSWRKVFYLKSRLSIKSFSTVQSSGVLASLQVLKPDVRRAFNEELAIYIWPKCS